MNYQQSYGRLFLGDPGAPEREYDHPLCYMDIGAYEDW